ncbi:hypothetical protein [Azospirillum rugosum]|uniref:Uncharacterized protein n=1 Tax=Azospirillum rugosum TaxID=416170 RepID=A0ABS4SLX1_9PROT|nr:hypothetical protein [Azospirillum rugosum]MBP2293525.1 hypothetical protein [Azospirillum rugosum]MDQ0529204.1 hypothetical protein [Azospirillum rugosum]
MKKTLLKILRLPHGRGKSSALASDGPSSARERTFAFTRDHLDKLDKLFGEMDGRSVVTLARSVERGELDALCEGLDRQQLLATLRPALRREQAPRTPTLWRRLCRHAEHFFVDKIQHFPGAHWHIARPLIRAAEGLVEAQLPQWNRFKEDYAQATTPESRILITIDAAEAVSRLLRSPKRPDWEPALAKASGQSLDQVAAGLDALAGCFAMARWYFHAQRAVFYRSDDETDLIFFQSAREKPTWEIDEQQIDALHRVLTTLSEDTKDYAHFLLIQLSVDLKDRAIILTIAPPVIRHEMTEKLGRPPFGAVMDFLVSSIEKGTRDFVADVARWRKMATDDADFVALTATILSTIQGVERQIQHLNRVVRMRKDNVFVKRIEKARLAVGMAVAGVLLPRSFAILDVTFADRTPLETGATAEIEKLLASLLNVSWRMAETGGQNLAAASSKEQVFGIVSRAAVAFRPSLFKANPGEAAQLATTLAHTACIAGRLGATGTISEMQDRLGPIWEHIPQLWPCRDGTKTCCRAFVRPAF